MKRMNFVILFVVLFAMTCILCIGYATLSTTLRIEGSAQLEGRPYRGVYIKEMKAVRASNASCQDYSFVAPTNVITKVDVSSSGGSVTYEVLVHNNTEVTYWYIGPRCTDDYAQNALVGAVGGISIMTMDHLNDSSPTFNNEDWIPPDTERVFYVTYTYGANAQSVCENMINLHFDIRMDAVHDEFLSVLNGTSGSTSYEQLKEIFEQEYIKNGSVSISTESHPEVFESLFADLMVNIDGVEREASVVIRRENLDKDVSSGDDYSGSGPKGCEYTLYITVEPLTPGSNPTVYAIAYSAGASGMGDQWYQVGELYQGTAPIKADGSIDYEKWTAVPATYEIADGISYQVAAPNGDQYDIMKTMEDLISAQDQDLFNDIDNTRIFKKTYDIIQRHPDSTDPAVIGLRQAFEDASHLYVNLNNGQEFKVVRDQFTRAEIIYALKNIQEAMDYYRQAYPE